MTTTNGVSSTGAFPSSTRVSIADLEHQHGDLSDSYISASVSLVWPYSSSTRKFSLLLSETSAGPGKTRRQVKVVFHNGAAKAAQESRIGIGDNVKLSMEGCAWQIGQDEISTPGKRLGYDIEFRKTLTLQVNPDTPSAQVVHYVWNGVPESEPEPEPTPTAQSIILAMREVDVSPSKIPVQFHSPNSRNSFRLSSGSFIEASLDPFSEDKDYVYGRNRKRTKFARDSSAWRLLDEDEAPEIDLSSPIPPPPQKQHPVTNLEAALQQPNIPPDTVDLTSPVDDTFEQLSSTIQPPETAQHNQKPDDQFIMPPPQTPVRSLAREARHIDITERGPIDLTTPRLHPLASPGLPLVSPLVSRFGVETGYFSTAPAPVSELDASSISTHDRNGSVVSTNSDDSLIVVEPAANQYRDSQDVQHGDMAMPSEDAHRSQVMRDGDTYGAREIAQPQPAHEAPVKAASNVLDALEEFLDMSPEDPDASNPSAKPQSTAVHDEAPPNLQQPSRGTSRSGSAVPSLDGAHDEEEEQLPPSYPQAEENAPSPLEQQPIEVVESDELESGSESASKSPSLEDGSESVESELAEKSASSSPEYVREHSDDGRPIINENGQTALPRYVTATADDREDELPAQATPSPELIPQDRQAPGASLLPTPEQTQEQEVVISDASNDKLSHPADTSLLPTPNQTQVYPDFSQSQPSTSQPEAIKEPVEVVTIEDFEPVTSPPQENMEPETSRRTSQRLTRKPILSDNIQSPYFTPRPQARPPIPQPADEEGVMHASSPAEAPPSSPTRQTRGRTPAEDAETSPLQHAEVDGYAVKDLSNKMPVSKISKTAQGKPTGLTTSIAYYTPLASLHENFNLLVDVVAVCADNSTHPERAKTGPKDWHTTLRLADPSSDISSGSTQAVQIFRHAKAALPVTKKGDTVILRDFRVQTQKHKSILLSTDSSAWAVFDGSLDERSMVDDPVIIGPPLEYGRGETAYVKKIAGWWKDEGEERFPARPLKLDSQAPQNTEELDFDAQPPVDSEMNDAPADDTLKPTRQSRRKQDLITESQSANVQNNPDTIAEEIPKSSRKSRQNQNLAIETQPPTAQESPIASVEEPPKSPIRTRRKQKLAEEAKEDVDDALADTTNTKSHQMPSMTPIRRQPSRRTKTPTAKIGANDGAMQEQISPLQPTPTTTKRARATKSPSIVHELRDGTTYVDDAEAARASLQHTPALPSPRSTRRTRTQASTSPSIVHELRDGTRYVDDDGDGNEVDDAQGSPKKPSPKQASPKQTQTAISRRTTRRTRATKSPTIVHDLRDGTKYVDDAAGEGPRKMRDKESVHELRNGRRYADEE